MTRYSGSGRALVRGVAAAVFLGLVGLMQTSGAHAMAASQRDPLIRQGQLGVSPAPLTPAARAALNYDGEGGVFVQTVLPQSTAADLGVQQADIITRLNAAPVTTPQDLIAGLSDIRAGETISLSLWRAGETLDLSGPLKARPFEQLSQGRSLYGAVATADGHVRTIMALPEGVRRPPVVYLLPGYPCQSMEATNPNGFYAQIINAFLAEGIAVWRVEKPGVGDSQTKTRCQTSGFGGDLDAFVAGYRDLLKRDDIDTDEVTLFGISMGGWLAPLLSKAVAAPAGIAVYGTGLRNWRDYMQDVVRIQPFLLDAEDPADAEARSEALRPVLDAIFTDKVHPEEATRNDPEAARLLADALGYQGGDQLLFRHIRFWRDLGDLRMAAAWRDADAPVLSLYGESDFAAIHDEDHRAIADIVNHYRPGLGTFVQIPRTNHFMAVVGTRAEHRKHRRLGTIQSLNGAVNPQIVETIVRWMRDLREDRT